ncbi:hypothetical protein P7K49_000512 [Saguinus oedipus]|uniref:Uncharacterized protein n=1 Tax=Saguinus oedipus TaxID=9490 RepID=A0ABQ9WBX0_SAGOE|nr:hypothetical protein P7K49_000512 [Saguinus oedipus]
MWDQIIRVKRYERVPMILVHNKVDLEGEREVLYGEGKALAEEWSCPFTETSAKNKASVDELFAEIVQQMNYAAQPNGDEGCCSACVILPRRVPRASRALRTKAKRIRLSKCDFFWLRDWRPLCSGQGVLGALLASAARGPCLYPVLEGVSHPSHPILWWKCGSLQHARFSLILVDAYFPV